ncbi:MAG: hypothetical protein OEV51_00580 [Nitrospira sp.]|jgi:hypothetical protein|nr:hypothetical protein [Nitrospira sp.]
MSLRRPYFVGLLLLLEMTLVGWRGSLVGAADHNSEVGNDLQVEVTKKGAGKQVVIAQGTKEWFMLIDVTPENAVVIRQEKEHDRYLVDESETHDRPMTPAEVDAAISDYVNSVKARVQKK